MLSGQATLNKRRTRLEHCGGVLVGAQQTPVEREAHLAGVAVEQTGDHVAGEPGAPEALGDYVPLAHAAPVHCERVRRVTHALLHILGTSTLIIC